jgi:chorismate synthase
MAVFEREAKRLDQVQGRSHGQRSATNVAGVPMNLRLDEHDVE